MVSREGNVRVALLCVQRAERLDEDETAYLQQLRAKHDHIEKVCRLSQDFADLLRARQGDQLDAWIERVVASEIQQLQRFATGLLADEAAKIAVLHVGPVLGGPPMGTVIGKRLSVVVPLASPTDAILTTHESPSQWGSSTRVRHAPPTRFLALLNSIH